MNEKGQTPGMVKDPKEVTKAEIWTTSPSSPGVL